MTLMKVRREAGVRPGVFGLLVLSFALIFAGSAVAQLQVGGDALSKCSEIEGLRKQEMIPEARDAARRCLEGLEKLLEGEVGNFFLEDVAGWKRTRFEQNNALGMRSASGSYTKGNLTIKVSMIGGSGSGAGLAGAIGGMARLGLMGGTQQQEVSVAGLPTSILPDGQMMVTLEDGTILSFQCRAFKTPEAALEGMGAFINEFPVKDINRILSGG